MKNHKYIEKTAKILALLAVKPFVKETIALLMANGDYTQNQKNIADEVKVFPSMLHVDIRKMVELGILEENPIGRQKYYKINRPKAFVLLTLIRALETATEEI
jgi:DNA-binding Lrp family transcriptional regulator